MLPDNFSFNSLLRPDDKLDSVFDITIGYLNKYSIKGLLLDMDNTLIARNEGIPSLQCLSWVSDLKESGIKLCILSNNSSAQRVIQVSNYLDIPAVLRAYKPLPLVAGKVISQLFSLPYSQVMIAGDQYFTDIACGNLLGIRSVYIEPMGPEIVLYRKWLISFDKKLHTYFCEK